MVDDRLEIQDFLELYIKKIVKNPDYLRTSVSVGDKSDYVISIGVLSDDVGRVIGRDGKMVSALKNILSAHKAKNGLSYELFVSAIDK